jgi:cytosine/adenosine deaminase-related metal-dependent hydrolase
LASNTTLSILDEIRFLHKHHQDFDQATLLQMATINGAKSLGFEETVGTITKGKAADLTAIPIHRNANCPIEDLLTSNEQPTWTMINGVIV